MHLQRDFDRPRMAFSLALNIGTITTTSSGDSFV